MKELSCREFIEFLDDYLDNKQADDVRAVFERHLAECPYCVDYLKTYVDSIEITRAACAQDIAAALPPDAPEELIQAILAARRTT